MIAECPSSGGRQEVAAGVTACRPSWGVGALARASSFRVAAAILPPFLTVDRETEARSLARPGFTPCADVEHARNGGTIAAATGAGKGNAGQLTRGRRSAASPRQLPPANFCPARANSPAPLRSADPKLRLAMLSVPTRNGPKAVAASSTLQRWMCRGIDDSAIKP